MVDGIGLCLKSDLESVGDSNDSVNLFRQLNRESMGDSANPVLAQNRRFKPRGGFGRIAWASEQPS